VPSLHVSNIKGTGVRQEREGEEGVRSGATSMCSLKAPLHVL
jgi:hypothetical protein